MPSKVAIMLLDIARVRRVVGLLAMIWCRRDWLPAVPVLAGV
jgi:hypothetical protein